MRSISCSSFWMTSILTFERGQLHTLWSSRQNVVNRCCAGSLLIEALSG